MSFEFPKEIQDHIDKLKMKSSLELVDSELFDNDPEAATRFMTAIQGAIEDSSRLFTIYAMRDMDRGDEQLSEEEIHKLNHLFGDLMQEISNDPERAFHLLGFFTKSVYDATRRIAQLQEKLGEKRD